MKREIRNFILAIILNSPLLTDEFSIKYSHHVLRVRELFRLPFRIAAVTNLWAADPSLVSFVLPFLILGLQKLNSLTDA